MSYWRRAVLSLTQTNRSWSNPPFIPEDGKAHILQYLIIPFDISEQSFCALGWYQWPEGECHYEPLCFRLEEKLTKFAEVKDVFCTAGHDLGMKPVLRQRKERAQVHILICLLSLTLLRTVQQWMDASGISSGPRKLLEEMQEIRPVDALFESDDP